MGFFQWADKKVKAQTIWDIGVLKIFCTLVGMVIGAYFSLFVKANLWSFIIVALVLFIYLIIRFFRAGA